MRKIKRIIVHTTATKEGVHYTVSDIDRWHRELGYAGIGYHYVILLDGTVCAGRPVRKIGAHCKGFNTESIGICYVGGLDNNDRAADTRTPEQKKSLQALIENLIGLYPTITEVVGHRDMSPDKNGDGKIDRHEWVKDCPCFDAKEEYKNLI